MGSGASATGRVSLGAGCSLQGKQNIRVLKDVVGDSFVGG